MKTFSVTLKITLLCIAFTVIGLALYYFCPAFHPGVNLPSLGAGSSGVSDRVIIIDAGHGGQDGGAQAPDGTLEKDINLTVASELSDILRFSGYNVIMTREDDVMLGNGAGGKKKQADLSARLKLASSYDGAYLVSIHMNKFSDPRCKGTQIWYSTGDARSKELALTVRDTVRKYLQPNNTRECKPATSAIYILHKAIIPAILVECGFVSNEEDLANLKNKDYQIQLAATLAAAIMNGVTNEGT